MPLDLRKLAVATTGFCAFVNLYSPQALLPELAREFGVGPAETSATMTAGTAAIALTAPFTGALADVLGRRQVITAAMLAVVIPMALIALSTDVQSMIVWRFLQGLLLPPILAVISLAGAMLVAAVLPRERGFVRSEGLGASARQMLRHLRNPQLVATYAIGFGVLFNFIAIFTFVSFHLAAPPYGFSPTLLGAVFVTYLAGSVTAPMIGWAMARFGRQRFVLGVIGVWACGALVLLAQPIVAIIAGLLLCAVCGMLCQAISTGYVTAIATEGRSSAVGLYVTAFYVGGSMGALLPGLTWSAAGWPACVAMALAMLAVMAAIATLAYRRVAA